MSPRPAALDADPLRSDPAPTDSVSAVVLKGSKAGLEIVIDGTASADVIGDDLTALLAEAPSFFAGSQARVRVAGRLPPGALARLEEVTARFELTIVEVGPLRPAERERVAAGTTPVAAAAAGEGDGVPRPNLADGSAPLAEGDDDADLEVDDGEPDVDDVLVGHRLAFEAAGDPLGPGARLFVGPVRSGAVLEARGHLVILGDVNPGAEVRAEGNILVLGRLRGVAHAAIGGEVGFILAHRLEPQQVRIGNLVARAGADDSPGEGVEIAYATGKTIVVERYQGRLPSGLAASL